MIINLPKTLPVLLGSILITTSTAMSQVETVEKTAAKIFRFHIQIEPVSLDPVRVQSADASYFLNNVMRGLYSYDNDAGLVEEGAKKCRFKSKLKLECELAVDALWSDGSAIVADDYVRSFRRLVHTTGAQLAVELLENLKNAVKVHSGEVKPELLGLRAVDSHHLEFEFEKPDPEFLYKLCSSVLVPIKNETFPTSENSRTAVTNGPYKVTSWTKGHRVRLEPNLRYKRGNPSRPNIEILFIDDDETALNLYEQGELTFLRRLPTTLIPTMRHRADFIQVPVARFDYLGFGPELDNETSLREAMARSLDFDELARIYDSMGTPGCPSLPRHLMQDEPCIQFDLARAKEAFAKVSPAAKAKRYKLMFSKLGGDDIKKGAEWEQAQWKKNLSLAVDLESSEQGAYLARLRERTPAIFRKGIGLQRPTCLAALETFSKNGSENFIHFESEEFEKVLTELGSATTLKVRQRFCSEGLKLLLASNRILPLGRIHFTLLARPEFKGWSLNVMNQLDLAQLKSGVQSGR